MLWLFYVVLIVLGLLLKKSMVYDFLVIVFLGVLSWINIDAADYKSVYLPIYQNPFADTNVDFGWSILCEIGNLIGLSYNGFACILTVLALVALRQVGRYLEVNTSFMLALFMIYPGLMSIVQFRQFIASVIGALALMVFASSIRYKYIWFSLLIVVAFLIHRSAAILLVLLFMPLLHICKRTGKAIVLALFFCVGIIVFLNANAIGSLIFGEYRTDVYLGASGGENIVSPLGGIRNMLLIFAMAFVVYNCYRAICKISSSISVEGISSIHIAKIGRYTMLLNVSMIVLIPFVFISNDFMRFERYAFTYALILFAIMPAILVKHFRFLSCKFFYVFICLIFAYFYVANSFESVFGALLSFETFPQFFE